MYTKYFIIVVELKPAHFPPLPNHQQQPATDELASSTTTTTTTPPVPLTRSVADIVKSTVVVSTKPKKSIPVETIKKEQEVFPTLCQTTAKDLKNNSFSYADMLKKKDN
jgi:hypothetical protein